MDLRVGDGATPPTLVTAVTSRAPVHAAIGASAVRLFRTTRRATYDRPMQGLRGRGPASKRASALQVAAVACLGLCAVGGVVALQPGGLTSLRITQVDPDFVRPVGGTVGPSGPAERMSSGSRETPATPVAPTASPRTVAPTTPARPSATAAPAGAGASPTGGPAPSASATSVPPTPTQSPAPPVPSPTPTLPTPTPTQGPTGGSPVGEGPAVPSAPDGAPASSDAADEPSHPASPTASPTG